MRKFILITIFCFFNLSLYPQSSSNKDYRLVVTLHNAPFDSLSLVDYKDMQRTFIKGKSIGEFKWEFTIGDSIVSTSENMILIVPNKDTISNAYHQIRFFRVPGDIKTTLASIGVQDEINYIEAEYKRPTLFEKENVSIFTGITDSVIIGNLICDDFNLTLKNDSSDITVRSLAPMYCWFPNDNNSLSYNEQLQSYINLSKKYPGSRYLITYLALNLHKFKARQDVKSIYQNFSNAQKSSKWSKKIEHYLSGDFVNSSLVNLDSRSLEPIVQDASKYNLIIFSASWCVPCIEEIPLLKKLQKDLKKHVNFTSISMDNEKNVKAFQNLMIKNNVPWRSLYAYRDLEKIRDLYFVVAIPHSLLIYPDGHMEIMDIRSDANQKKLFSLM